eukprot:COSAG05_NODE_1271_length_5315_cov_2.397738_3_plen_63_part_00
MTRGVFTDRWGRAGSEVPARSPGSGALPRWSLLALRTAHTISQTARAPWHHVCVGKITVKRG